MKTDGLHVVADIWLAEYSVSNADLIHAVELSLNESGMTVLDSCIHEFGESAVTGVWLLSESHFSVHTFPERNFMSVDCYTCGDKGKPLHCVSVLASNISIAEAKIRVLQRGV